MLYMQVQLYCDVCAIYPVGTTVSRGNDPNSIWLPTTANGAVVLPEGWLRHPTQWESQRVFCSLVCLARECELDIPLGPKEYVPMYAYKDSLHCQGGKREGVDGDGYCRATCSRYAADWMPPRLILPPGWDWKTTKYMLCGDCMAVPAIVAKLKAYSDAPYDP